MIPEQTEYPRRGDPRAGTGSCPLAGPVYPQHTGHLALPLPTAVTCSHRAMDPVLKAIKEGDEEALKVMIQDGKNLAEPNKEGWLPLHEAAYYGQLGCLKVLQQGEGQLCRASRDTGLSLGVGGRQHIHS